MSTLRHSPATSSPLSQTWLRLTGKDSWLSSEATVFSCDWTDLPDQIDSPVGHYHVVYSYRAEGTLYTGRFADYGMQDEEYFKRGDVFQVRYDPRNPAKSYYPELRTRHKFALLCAAIRAGLGIVVGAFAIFKRYVY